MNDRPTAVELVNAVRQYLESELLPTLTDQRLKFQTLIAANVLSIAERELQSEEAELAYEYQSLLPQLDFDESARTLTEMRAAVRRGNERLCKRIREGYYDDPQHFLALLGMVREFVERKLIVANPRYLAACKPTKESRS